MIRPKVTVMMTVFNAQRFLFKAVISILKQTFEDFELLIVDDASTDSSVDIVCSFRDSRIRLIRNPQNKGVAFSRKRALTEAQGEYVAVLDADDEAMPTRLAREVEYLDNHPDVALVGSANYVIDDDDRIIDIWRPPAKSHVIRWTLLFNNCFCNSSVMFRRDEAVSIGGYDESVFVGEDYDLFVRLCSRFDLANFSQPLVAWRKSTTGLGRVEPLYFKEQAFRTVIKSIRLLTGHSVPMEVARCLNFNNPEPAANIKVLSKSFGVIRVCLESMLRNYENREVKREVVALALRDVLRLARMNRRSYCLSVKTMFICMKMADISSLRDTVFLRILIPSFLSKTQLRNRWRRLIA